MSRSRRPNFESTRDSPARCHRSQDRADRRFHVLPRPRLSGQPLVELGRFAGGEWQVLLGDRRPLGRKWQGPEPWHGHRVLDGIRSGKEVAQDRLRCGQGAEASRGALHAGKIHSRIDLGSDGCLYFATHRGSTRVTTDHITTKEIGSFATIPKQKTEVVVQGPVAKHCIPNSVLDPERLIFYGGTASGEATEGKDVRFFAYDLKNRKLLYAGENGSARYMIFAHSTGRLYYVPGGGDGELMRYEPKPDAVPTPVAGTMIGVRAATQETPQHKVYNRFNRAGGHESAALLF